MRVCCARVQARRAEQLDRCKIARWDSRDAVTDAVSHEHAYMCVRACARVHEPPCINECKSMNENLRGASGARGAQRLAYLHKN